MPNPAASPPIPRALLLAFALLLLGATANAIHLQIQAAHRATLERASILPAKD